MWKILAGLSLLLTSVQAIGYGNGVANIDKSKDNSPRIIPGQYIVEFHDIGVFDAGEDVSSRLLRFYMTYTYKCSAGAEFL